MDSGGTESDPDIHELVRRLNTHLGTTLVAALAGARDSRSSYGWADDVTPVRDAEQRIRAAYRVWVTIARSQSRADRTRMVRKQEFCPGWLVVGSRPARGAQRRGNYPRFLPRDQAPWALTR